MFIHFLEFPWFVIQQWPNKGKHKKQDGTKMGPRWENGYLEEGVLNIIRSQLQLLYSYATIYTDYNIYFRIPLFFGCVKQFLFTKVDGVKAS